MADVPVSKGEYLLRRDSMASLRLTAQHAMYKSTMRFLLHPSITVPPQARIADVATGNGCWLMDLDVDASCKLDGFDISLDQVPSLSPPNTTFHAWDVFQQPPAEFQGVFDIVHVRLITVLIKNDDPSTIIRNLGALLKPGGFLQWEELDNVHCEILSPHGTSAPTLTTMLANLADSVSGEWKKHMSRHVAENGFAMTNEAHIRDLAPSSLKYWTDVYISLWVEYVVESGKMSDADVRAYSAKASDEAREGANMKVPIWVWVAQKEKTG